MKKVLKKSVSVLMIVMMCLTMAPLQGFVGLDIGEWFASESKAAAPIGENEFCIYVGAKEDGENELIKSAIVQIKLGKDVIAQTVTDSDGKATFKKTDIIEKGYEINLVMETAIVYAYKNVSGDITISSSIGVDFNNRLNNYINYGDEKKNVLILDEAQCNIVLSVAYEKGYYEAVYKLCKDTSILFGNLTGKRFNLTFSFNEKSSSSKIQSSNCNIKFFTKYNGRSNATPGGYGRGGYIFTGLTTSNGTVSALELVHELGHYIFYLYDEYYYGLGSGFDANRDGDYNDQINVFWTEDSKYLLNGSTTIKNRIVYDSNGKIIDSFLSAPTEDGFMKGDLNKNGKLDGTYYYIESESFERQLLESSEKDWENFEKSNVYIEMNKSEMRLGAWLNTDNSNGLFHSPIHPKTYGIMQSNYSGTGSFFSDESTYDYLTDEQKANKSLYPELFTWQYYNSESCKKVIDKYLKGKVETNCKYDVFYTQEINADGEEYIIDRNDYIPEYTVEEDNTELKAIGNTDILDNSIGYTEEIAPVDFSYADGEVTAETGSSEKELYAFIIDYDNLTKKQVEIIDNKATFDYSVGDNVVFYLLTDGEDGIYHYNDYSFGSFDSEIVEGIFSSNSGLTGSFDDNAAVSEKLIVISDENKYENGDYKSLGGSVRFINTDESATVSGTVETAVSFHSEIDFSSLSVFKVVDGAYEEISKGYYHGEDTVAYTYFSYEDDGTYIVMAKDATEKEYLPVKNLSVESGIGEVDGAVYFSFEDANEGAVPVAYNIYHKNEDFTSFDDAGLEVITVKNVDSFSTNIDFSDDVNEKFFAVEILYEDGGKTAFGGTVKHQVKLLDSNNDGIPDFWLLQNGIEDHDGVAEEDPDYDGANNLDEYLNGTNPLVSESGNEFLDYKFDITDAIVAEELFDGFPVKTIEFVANAMFNMESDVDVTAYDISIDDVVALFSAIAKYYPTEYSLLITDEFSYKVAISPSMDRIMKIRFYYGEDLNLSDYQRRVKEVNAEIERLVEIIKDMNDFEKALYINDYLCLNSEYDHELADFIMYRKELSYGTYGERYSEHAMLINGTGVCGVYALAYRAVLNAAGLECLYISTKETRHAWNLVKIDGKWYHVDVCWNDPGDYLHGKSNRTFFLLTDEEITDFIHVNWNNNTYKATSTKYSDMPRESDRTQKYYDNKWYHLKNDKLYSTDIYGENETFVCEVPSKCFDIENHCVYYSKGRNIFEYNLKTEQICLVYSVDYNSIGISNFYDIFNFYVENNNIIVYVFSDEILTVKGELDRERYSAITGLTMSQSQLELDLYDTYTLTAEIVSSASTEGFDIDWTSSNPSIAKVDNGVIKAFNTGSTVIKAEFGDFSAECIIEVNGNGLEGACNEKVYWIFTPENETLTIYGTGDMPSGTYWKKLKDDVKFIVVKEGITGISAFGDHSNLERVNLPQSLISIGTETFENCTSLKGIELPDGITTIGISAFYNSGLEDIRIPNSVETIKRDAFHNCEGLKNVIIGEGVATIENGAFTGCTNLEVVYLPDSVKTIGASAFRGCDKLSSVKLSQSLTSIDEYAFEGCNKLKEIFIPKTVTSIGTYAFLSCPSLEKITVDTENEYYSSDNNGILFDEDLTALISYPGNSNLIDYTIPETVVEIKGYAFYEARKLKRIFIGDNVSKIGYRAFVKTTGLEEFVVSENNQSFAVDNGVLFNKDMTTLVAYTAGSKNKIYTIPDGITEIASAAFHSSQYLSSLYMPSTLKKINGRAFYNCDRIRCFNLPSKVSFNFSAFAECDSLEGLVINGGSILFTVSDYTEAESVIKCDKILLKDFSSKLSISGIMNTASKYKFEGTFYGASTTSAEWFANQYSCEYVNTETESHTHDYILMNYVEFTDTTDGYECYSCGCGDSSYENVYHNNGEIETTKATCTLDGSKSVECKVCGEVTVLETLPATGKHDYQIASTTPGNCTTAPVYHYSCSLCGGTEDKTGRIDDGHKYIETVIEPTCTEKGYTTATCSECGETVIYDFKSPKGHNLDIKRKEDYCSAHDTIEYSCSVCDYKEVVAPDVEMLETTTVTVEPTCTKSGSHTDVCDLCGATVAIEVLNPLSHDYSDKFTIDREATCTEAGSKSKHCSRCDATREITEIPAAGHQNTSIINKTDATCTKNGYTGDIYCDDCETVIANGVSIDILAHNYSSVVTAPTCTSRGFTTHTCTACGEIYTSAETAILAHSYNAVVTPVTCTTNGYTTYTCTVCSHSYKGDTIPSTGHNYNDEGICTGCGRSRAENCSHMCHKSGFIGFIWKIVRFFWKLFKMNSVCDCGVKHW